MLLPLHSLHIYYGFVKDCDLDFLAEFLAEDEKKRSSQFQNPNDKHLYIASRALLRKLLASYLSTGINTIQFEYGSKGKPFVKGQTEIQFNIAHSKEVFLLGFVKNDVIGIDIEHLDRSFDAKKISEFLLSENELEKFLNSDQSLRQEQLLNCWVRKEAFVKAYGTGLSFPLKQLEVSFFKNEKEEIISTPWSDHEKSEWFLKGLDIPGNYRGAVAVRGTIETIIIKNILEDNPLSLDLQKKQNVEIV